jgi:hypothetical protein
MPGLKSINSKSLFGLSNLKMNWHYGSQWTYVSARQEVINRIATMTQPLPPGGDDRRRHRTFGERFLSRRRQCSGFLVEFLRGTLDDLLDLSVFGLVGGARDQGRPGQVGKLPSQGDPEKAVVELREIDWWRRQLGLTELMPAGVAYLLDADRWLG